MKSIKLLALTLLVAVSVNGLAQIQKVSHCSFTYIDLLNYSSHCRNDMANRVTKAIYDGKLKMYGDKALKNPLTAAHYQLLTEVRDMVSIMNPENPDDPSDFIDTVLVYQVEPRDFVLLDNDVVEIIHHNEARVYVSEKSLEKIFDKRLISLLDYFETKGHKSISDVAMSAFFKEQVTKMGADLYNYGIKGEMKAYVFDSLTKTYTPEEIEERTAVRNYVQLPNPDNPEDPYDMIDSIVVIPYTPNNIDKIRLYFEWETEGFESEAEFYAIAPTFHPMAAGIELPSTPIFLIKASDYQKKLKKDEAAFWQYFYSYMLQNRAAGDEYDVFTEDNLPE